MTETSHTRRTDRVRTLRAMISKLGEPKEKRVTKRLLVFLLWSIFQHNWARKKPVKKTVLWDTLHKEGVPPDLIIQVLCCFLLLLLFCHMALVIGFQIFGQKRLDDAYAVVVDVDNLITLAVEVVSS